MNTRGIVLTAALAAVGLAPAAFPAGPQATSATNAFELRMDGKSDEAEATLRRALAETPDDARAWFELARTEFYLFRFDDAAEAIARAGELAPQEARYHYFAGLNAAYNAVSKAHSAETNDQVGPEMGKALTAFDKAVGVDPDFHEARLQLINMLIEAPSKQGGSRAMAKKHVEVLESQDPVYGVEGRCMLLKGRKAKKAVDLWQQAVDAHPARADAHAGLAEAYLHAGDVDLAIPRIDEAIRLDPSRTTLLLALCRQCVAEGDTDRAQKAVERYLGATPSPPAPLQSYGTFCLAMLQKMQGNQDQAEALLAKAKQLDPRIWTTQMEPPAALFDAP